MGWAVGAGLALTFLLLVAIANLVLIVARIAHDRIDAKFLVLAIASLGSGQAFFFYLVAGTGFLSAQAFEIIWLISIGIAISSLIAVLLYGGATRGADRF